MITFIVIASLVYLGLGLPIAGAGYRRTYKHKKDSDKYEWQAVETAFYAWLGTLLFWPIALTGFGAKCTCVYLSKTYFANQRKLALGTAERGRLGRVVSK